MSDCKCTCCHCKPEPLPAGYILWERVQSAKKILKETEPTESMIYGVHLRDLDKDDLLRAIAISEKFYENFGWGLHASSSTKEK